MKSVSAKLFQCIQSLLLLLVLLALLSIVPAAANQLAVSVPQPVFKPPYGVEAIANLTSFRSGLLAKIAPTFNADKDPAAHALGFLRFFPFQPFICCPPDQPYRRYGSRGDGGKWLCDITGLQAPCLVYSIGSNGDYSFELDVLSNSECDIHTFDCTYSGRSINSRHHYHQLCIGGHPGPHVMTWLEVTKSLGHQDRHIDIVKMDIEGAEPLVLAQLQHDMLLPRQIVLEMHLRPPPYILKNGTTGIDPAAARTPAQLALVMLHMANLGYGITAQENNIWGDVGCCGEWSFLLVEEHVLANASQVPPAQHRRAGARSLPVVALDKTQQMLGLSSSIPIPKQKQPQQQQQLAEDKQWQHEQAQQQSSPAPLAQLLPPLPRQQQQQQQRLPAGPIHQQSRSVQPAWHRQARHRRRKGRHRRVHHQLREVM